MRSFLPIIFLITTVTPTAIVAQSSISQKLRECEGHLAANRLTTGHGGTALTCYEDVLTQDFNNAKAWAGLATIEARYNTWINRALNRGRQNQAKRLQARLRQVQTVAARLQASTSVPQSPLTREMGDGNSSARSVARNQASMQYDNKVALVIGNWQYLTKPLYNPENDAHDIALALEALGFEVIRRHNLNRSALDKAIVDFKGRLKGNQVGFFYYAGHGLHVKDENYMIPVDFDPKNLKDTRLTKRAATPVQWVMDIMAQAGTQINIVVIDACRAIPKPKKQGVHRFLGDTVGFEGLSKVSPPIGTIIGYAADIGGLAKDNETERNGLYTKHLLKHLNQSGLTIEKVFKNTATDVAMASDYGQVPWYHSALMGADFCLVNCQTPEELAAQARLVQEQEKRQREQAKLEAELARLAQENEAMRREQARLQAEKERLARLRKPTPVVVSNVFRDRLADGSDGPEMVWIPAGSFRMGDLQGGGYGDEKPVHSVSVKRFAMGRYEVTVGEYLRFVKATGRHAPEWQEAGSKYNIKTGTRNQYKNLGSALTNENHPIVGVSWNDATAYAKWLSQQTGHQYRLPTEAEWEYAARAGTETKYWWGNEIGKNRANCDSDCGDRFKYTAPVGSFAANPFGLHDTAGNVWEWTCSEYESRYSGKEQVCSTNDEGHFVLRGGSWGSSARLARTAYRAGRTRSERYGDYGARLARIK